MTINQQVEEPEGPPGRIAFEVAYRAGLRFALAAEAAGIPITSVRVDTAIKDRPALRLGTVYAEVLDKISLLLEADASAQRQAKELSEAIAEVGCKE